MDRTLHRVRLPDLLKDEMKVMDKLQVRGHGLLGSHVIDTDHNRVKKLDRSSMNCGLQLSWGTPEMIDILSISQIPAPCIHL